jgi:two-component system sensor histidine kinase HydH
MRKEVLQQKRLYLPAITIIALALTLTVIVAISSYRNIHRERQRVNENLLREGRILLRVFEETALSEMILTLSGGSQWEAALQKLLEDTARKPTIEYLLIADGNGRVVNHSQPDRIGDNVDPGLASSGRIVMDDTRKQDMVFEVSLPFRLIRDDLYRELPDRHKKLLNESSIKYTLRDHWAIIGLNMEQFEEARAEDLVHNIMMAVMMLVIGSASLYFIVVVQNYYLVNRTLNTMRTYTQNVVESMVDGLISVDESGIITTINQTASQIMEVNSSDVEGRDISEVLKSDECDIQEALFTDRPLVEKEITYQRNSGYTPLSVSVSPLKDEIGKAIGAVVIIRDLREIKELQEKVQRAERLASLGRLAAGIAHEIRNPLSSIRGFAQYFQGKFEPETKDVKYAKAMVDEIDRLNRIIEALLDFARPAEPKLSPYSIEDVLNHALGLMQADIDLKEVRLTKNVQSGIPEVMIDRDQMIQAILNILLNAVEAVNKRGEITVSASTEADNLKITISDTGSGIPEEDLPKVFDPFFTSRKSGTGLGLAIVHKIVENHNGEILVKSEVGRGTTFTILLPLRKGGKEDA